MDDIIEFFGELILEGAQELIDSKSTPLPVKIVAFVILTIFYCGLAVICIIGVVGCEEWYLKILLGLVAAGCLFLAGKMYWKLLTRNRR
ncbi:MAG: hypothetical protein E7490_10510 [Ruminococcaceae bacterium]|nr:hypothetical protein [Oscillospiraceae bacterium]